MQLIVEDFDDLLAGGDGFQHRLAHGAFLDGFDEGAGHGDV